MSIKGRIGEAEVLARLAEEAAELAQAALKMRRAMKMDYADARFNLVAELSDVLCCVDELFDDQNAKHILDCIITMIEDKRRRWEEGLNSHG